MNIITISDLQYMCEHQDTYFTAEDLKISKQFLIDNIVTEDLLKLYVIREVESWGNLTNFPIYFRYEKTELVGKYNNNDYPAEILEIIHLD